MLELIRQYDILSAFLATIQLALVSSLGALVIGTFVAVLRVSAP